MICGNLMDSEGTNRRRCPADSQVSADFMVQRARLAAMP